MRQDRLRPTEGRDSQEFANDKATGGEKILPVHVWMAFPGELFLWCPLCRTW